MSVLLLAACSTPEPRPSPEPAGTPNFPSATPVPPPTATAEPPSATPIPATLRYGKEVARGPVDDPRIALTFDCGAGSSSTRALLDLLKQNGVQATFFVTGEFADRYPDVTRRIATDG